MEATSPVHEHIETIVKHEEEFLARRSNAERWGDAAASVVGNISFVAGQLIIVLVWTLANSTRIVPFKHFDPSPFPLLSACLALESILLASFILMRQARLGRRSDEREHLMLQVLLLTEKEITAVLGINREIAGRLGLGKITESSDIEQLAKTTSIDDVAKSIQENLAGHDNA